MDVFQENPFFEKVATKKRPSKNRCLLVLSAFFLAGIASFGPLSTPSYAHGPGAGGSGNSSPSTPRTTHTTQNAAPKKMNRSERAAAQGNLMRERDTAFRAKNAELYNQKLKELEHLQKTQFPQHKF